MSTNIVKEDIVIDFGVGTGNFFQNCMPVKNGVESLNPPPSPHPLNTEIKKKLNKIIKIKNVLKFNECKQLWNEKEISNNKYNYRNINEDNYWNAYELLRRVWDDWFRVDIFPVEFKDRILMKIQKNIKSTHNFNCYYPFGSVKDLNTMTHKEAYNKYLNIINTIRIDENNEDITIFHYIIYSFVYAAKKVGVKYSREAIEKALCLYCYRLTLGAITEQTVVDNFNKKYNEENCIIKLASSDYEKYDIDAFIELPNKKIAVSIKNFGALDINTINHYRNELNKTKPRLYIGFDSVNNKEIKILNIEGIDITDKFSKFVRNVNK